MALLGVDEIWEFHGIPDKKDRCIISSHIVITFLSIELQRESTWVSFCICRSLLTSNGGESGEDICALSDPGKKFGPCVLRDIEGDLKIAVCPRSFCMHYTFRYTFSVKMTKFF